MRHLVGSVAIVAIAALVAIGGCTEKPIPWRSVADFAQKLQIDNFGEINANYFRGGAPRGGDYAALAAMGIRTVVNLRPERDDAHAAQLVTAAGMTFYRIPMSSRAAPTLEQVSEFMSLVTDPAHQPVFVHCAGGRHRTGVMTAIYRMEQDGWTAERAYREMKQYKFGSARLHPELKAFVFHYQPLRKSASRAVPQ